jgi:hypothetical protein
MHIASLELVEGDIRFEDLASGLNVIYLPSPDKRRLLLAAVRSALTGQSEELADARLVVLGRWGRVTIQVDGQAGVCSVTDWQGNDCTAEFYERVGSWLSADTLAAVYVARLGDPQALHETTHKVCGAALAEEHRRQWEALLRELEYAEPYGGQAARCQALRQEEAHLRALLPDWVTSQGDMGNRRKAQREKLQIRLAIARYWVRRLKKKVQDAVSEETRRQVQHRLEHWQGVCAKLREQLEHTSASQSDWLPDELPAEYATAWRRWLEVQAELKQLESQDEKQAQYWLQRIRQLIHNRPVSPVLEEANRWLRELTDGEFVALRTVQLGREAVVEQAGNKQVSCDVLSRTERVQVHLALCLAGAATAARVGHRVPLLINDALRYLPPTRLRPALELLQAHGRLHGQILLLTSQAHVATLCRSMGVAVHSIAGQSLNRSTADSTDEPLVRPIQEVWQQIVPGDQLESVTNETLPIPQAPPTPPPTRPENKPHTYNGTPRPLPMVSAPATAGHSDVLGRRASTCYCDIADTLEKLPWLTLPQKTALYSLGIKTVGCLLRADPKELAARMNGCDVSPQVLSNWQARLRLLCEVPGLKPYDASILVACGVTHPEQLADIAPEELYRLVSTFLATPEGSRLARSGTSEEIQRLTQWLRRMQTRHQQASSPVSPTVRQGGRAKGSAASASTAARTRRHSQSESPLQPHAAPAADQQSMDACASCAQEVGDGTSTNPDLPQVRTVRPEECEQRSCGNDQSDTLSICVIPGIEGSIARRLESLGVHSLNDLINCNTEELCSQINRKRITPALVAQWQQIAHLLLALPELAPHEAQLLVMAGITRIEQLRAMDAETLLLRIQRASRLPAARRVLKDHSVPNGEEVSAWLEASRRAGRPRAA